MSNKSELQSNNADLQALLNEINALPTAESLLEGVLKYTEQILTEEQQAQARENIGIEEFDESLLDGMVKYTEQSLTEAQKAQARENINAQNVINLQGMAVFEGSGIARTAIEYQDYAPAYSGLINLTASTTLTDTHMGRFIVVNSSSACTITLPAVTATYNEMEIINLGTGDVTISGLMQLGMTGVVLSQGDAVTLKSSGSYWCVIGSYKEV